MIQVRPAGGLRGAATGYPPAMLSMLAAGIYIGGGALVLILIVIVIVLLLRR